MKLWLVEFHGWGFAFAIVRAESNDDARNVARMYGSYGKTTVTELEQDGPRETLWEYENSPDSVRDD